ncbi:MAG: hypothetical protein QGF94_00140 [Candidatus Thalassarchaeaceae archaeon]|jgi:hypothetical protein|nr:hypothetical protein [Candidatus Thalassarchaeaceae archaeon]
MSSESPHIDIPLPEADPTEKMVFLQEQMVNFLKQYSMPILEVSLVLSKYTRQLTDALATHANEMGESIPPILAEPWPLLGHDESESLLNGPDLDSLLDNVDYERMDILDTILRTAMHATEMSISDALMQLRQWEHLIRSQLADAKRTGQLFSPLMIPDDW